MSLSPCGSPSMTSFQRDIGFSWNCFPVLWSQKLRDTRFRNVPVFANRYDLRVSQRCGFWGAVSEKDCGCDENFIDMDRTGALFECRFPWGFHGVFILKNTTKFQVEGASGEILAVLVGSDALRFDCWNDFTTVPPEGFSNHLIIENEARNMVDLDGWKFDFSRFLLLPPKIPKRSINFEGG